MSEPLKARDALLKMRYEGGNDERYDLGWHDAVREAVAILDAELTVRPKPHPGDHYPRADGPVGSVLCFCGRYQFDGWTYPDQGLPPDFWLHTVTPSYVGEGLIEPARPFANAGAYTNTPEEEAAVRDKVRRR